MNFYKKIIIIIAVPTMISACGEVSYKRGASVRDVENAHKACRGVSEANFSECLKKQGWEIQKFDDSDLFAEVSVTDNRGTPPAKTEQSRFVEVQENTSTNNAIESKPEQAKAIEQTDVVTNKNEADTTAAGASVAETKITPKPTPAPVDPLKTYKINSWWKFGGTPEHLKRDQNNCVATLGEAHQPNMATQTYTRGLIECLHKNGWKALKAMK